MAGMAVRTPPVDRVAAALRARLRGRNLRVSSRGVVHRTRPVRWLRGETIPGPACGTATGQLDPGEWAATVEAVSCLHCLRIDVTAPESHDMGQMVLFDTAA